MVYLSFDIYECEYIDGCLNKLILLSTKILTEGWF